MKKSEYRKLSNNVFTSVYQVLFGRSKKNHDNASNDNIVASTSDFLKQAAILFY